MLSCSGQDSGRLCSSIWPTFGSMLILEVYSDNLARFIYNGRVATAEGVEGCQAE